MLHLNLDTATLQHIFKMDTPAIVHLWTLHFSGLSKHGGYCKSCHLEKQHDSPNHVFFAVYPVENGPRHSRSDAAECSWNISWTSELMAGWCWLTPSFSPSFFPHWVAWAIWKRGAFKVDLWRSRSSSLPFSQRSSASTSGCDRCDLQTAWWLIYLRHFIGASTMNIRNFLGDLSG